MIPNNLLKLMRSKFDGLSWVKSLEISHTALVKEHLSKGFRIANAMFCKDYSTKLFCTIVNGSEPYFATFVTISDPKIIRLLLEKETSKSSDIVTSAVRIGDIAMLKFLLEQGFPVEEETLIAAIELNNYRAVKMLLSTDHNFDEVIVLVAVLKGSKKIANTLLEKGVKITPKIALGLRPQDFKNPRLKSFFSENFQLIDLGIEELKCAGHYSTAKNFQDLKEVLREQVC